MSETLFFVALLLGVIPLVFLKVFKISRFRTLFIEPFIWLVFISSIYEFLAYKFNLNTPYWFRFYILIDFLLLFYFYFYTLVKQYKILFYIFLITFLLFYIFLMIIWNENNSIKTDFYLTTFETIFVLIASILWFTGIFSELKETSLLHSPNYYFIAGFVLYYSGTFFLFLVSDFMIKNMQSQFLSYWNLNILFNILLRILIIIGIWKARKK